MGVPPKAYAERLRRQSNLYEDQSGESNSEAENGLISDIDLDESALSTEHAEESIGSVDEQQQLNDKRIDDDGSIEIRPIAAIDLNDSRFTEPSEGSQIDTDGRTQSDKDNSDIENDSIADMDLDSSALSNESAEETISSVGTHRQLNDESNDTDAAIDFVLNDSRLTEPAEQSQTDSDGHDTTGTENLNMSDNSATDNQQNDSQDLRVFKQEAAEPRPELSETESNGTAPEEIEHIEIKPKIELHTIDLENEDFFNEILNDTTVPEEELEQSIRSDESMDDDIVFVPLGRNKFPMPAEADEFFLTKRENDPISGAIPFSENSVSEILSFHFISTFVHYKFN